MLLIFEKGIRGGYSGVLGDRYIKANNKYNLDVAILITPKGFIQTLSSTTWIKLIIFTEHKLWANDTTTSNR